MPAVPALSAHDLADDPFGQVMGARRGYLATDTRAAAPETKHYVGLRNGDNGLGPRRRDDVIATLDQFDPALPVYVLDVNEAASLENARRITGGRQYHLQWNDKPLYHLELSASAPPACETVGELRNLLAGDSEDCTILFEEKEHIDSHKKLTAYQYFRRPDGQRLLALIVVY